DRPDSPKPQPPIHRRAPNKSEKHQEATETEGTEKHRHRVGKSRRDQPVQLQSNKQKQEKARTLGKKKKKRENHTFLSTVHFNRLGSHACAASQL
ncbi:hypothetical protein GW17_00036648, partial [Ensete ventricosum]